MDEYLSMSVAFSLWRRRVGQELQAYGITFHQYMLVRMVWSKRDLTLSAAALELGMDKPSMSLVARKCLASGWLERRASTSDKRAYRLSLTGKGEELLDRIDAEGRLLPGAIPDALDILDSAGKADLRRLLDRVARRARDLYGSRCSPGTQLHGRVEG
ncbi:MAG TPA: MarR family transcriptional regulator [Rectinemataceae bacterium]